MPAVTAPAVPPVGAEFQVTVLRVDRARLRFLDVPALDHHLADAGLRVAARYGDWDRTPLVASSPEIITIAQPT